MSTTVGFIGLANPHAMMYLESLQELPTEVTCACELNESVNAEDFPGLDGAPIYDDIEELFTSEAVDAVWMSLPNQDTPPAIELAAEYGVDVYAEKTLARTAAELEPAIDAAETAGITVVAGYQNRANAVTREMRSRVIEGFFGDLRAVEARMITSQLGRFRDASQYSYRVDSSRGGILQWLGCHTIDMLRFMLDEPAARVNAQVEYGADGVEVEDGATVQFELAESGALGTLQAGYYDREYDTYIGIHGSEGRAAWSGSDTPADRDVLELDSYTKWPVAPRRTIDYDYDDSMGYGGTIGLDYMANFLNTVEGRDSDPSLNATIHDSLAVLRFLDAVYESAETDEWVALE
ncbi:Gfo/Idh/MocA family protein [Saliphagus sp. LR7]|uniref:Gfo/Idh/MocA family protein n=1 Tax=Saliphagus sp. LR7 TaxID=2282654 RepID=UPI000DF73184|nr:Gfo/Idh/MocA family oxidoreductase [Saliphagus sp. LR7]